MRPETENQYGAKQRKQPHQEQLQGFLGAAVNDRGCHADGRGEIEDNYNCQETN